MDIDIDLSGSEHHKDNKEDKDEMSIGSIGDVGHNIGMHMNQQKND